MIFKFINRQLKNHVSVKALTTGLVILSVTDCSPEAVSNQVIKKWKQRFIDIIYACVRKAFLNLPWLQIFRFWLVIKSNPEKHSRKMKFITLCFYFYFFCFFFVDIMAGWLLVFWIDLCAASVDRVEIYHR